MIDNNQYIVGVLLPQLKKSYPNKVPRDKIKDPYQVQMSLTRTKGALQVIDLIEYYVEQKDLGKFDIQEALNRKYQNTIPFDPQMPIGGSHFTMEMIYRTQGETDVVEFINLSLEKLYETGTHTKTNNQIGEGDNSTIHFGEFPKDTQV